MKKAFKLLSITFITLLSFSCSSDKNETTVLPENKGVLKYENKTYVFKEDGLTSKYLNGKKEFDFHYENLLKTDAKLVAKKSSTNRNGEDEQVIIVENNQTGEFVEFSNINEIGENKISFDVTTSNGLTFNNLEFESDELNLTTVNSTQNKYCWQCVIIVVGTLVDAVVELASDNYDSNCNAAIKACGSAGVKTITIIDQGWFTPASCTVVCK
jgi:hypothetical protein